jgi:hypothetical protein
MDSQSNILRIERNLTLKGIEVMFEETALIVHIFYDFQTATYELKVGYCHPH